MNRVEMLSKQPGAFSAKSLKIFLKRMNGFSPGRRIISEVKKTTNGGFIMKKLLLGVLAGVLVFSAGSIQVSAACHGAGRHCGTAGTRNCVAGDTTDCGRYCYLDEDEDGICDNCGESHRNCLDGSENCFVDEDNDGICDNCSTHHSCGAAGYGQGSQYIDSNNDGICDNYAAGQSAGRGGRGGHHGSRGRHCR